MDFNGLFQVLSSIPDGVQRATEQGLRKSAVIVMKRAKSKFGTYQPASHGYPAWPKLKPTTVARKYTIKSGVLKGFLNKKGVELLHQPGGWKVGNSGVDAPLIDTGHLRNAITTDETEIRSGTVYVGVAKGGGGKGSGSTAGAAAHEFGYAPKGIPARPYLRPALEESREEIRNAVAQAIRDELGRWGR
jgi:phage gpG-like protein